MSLDGQKILVTGAGGGIGRAVVEALIEGGAKVAASDLQAPTGTGADLEIECDVTSSLSVETAVRKSVETLSGLTGLAYITGTLHDAVPIALMDMDEWDRVFEVNVKGLVRLAHHVVPLLADIPGASMVAISSWWGHSGHAFFAPYCASKAAIISTVQSMADELAPVGIRVNSVAPGNIDTSMHRRALVTEAEKRGISFDEMKDIEWAKIPLGIAGPPSSIADAVAFLLSPQASYITGATLDVNGGVLLR